MWVRNFSEWGDPYLSPVQLKDVEKEIQNVIDFLYTSQNEEFIWDEIDGFIRQIGCYLNLDIPKENLYKFKEVKNESITRN